MRRRIARDPRSLASPLAERFPAAVLLADLSGFSVLAERLARRGARGAEDLKDLLNILFGRLVDLVDAHGGEVLKFAGDATLALWPAEERDDALAAQSAASCALAAQELLHGIDVPGDVSLRLHAGVGAGEVWAATVGGAAERWELVLAGPAVEQAVAAMTAARPGEVMVSAPVWERIAAFATGEVATGGVRLGTVRAPHRSRPPRRIDLAPGAEPLLRAFVPRALQAKLDARQTDWLAEFRHVTVVFVNVEGLDYAAGDCLDRLQRAVVTVQAAVYRYGGSVNQVLVDDKGTVFVCGWGLALHTHGDDAVRATRAAMEIRRGLQDAGLAGSFGVATGEAFTGLRGSLRRAEYAMIGSTVNLGARLMQAAGGDVLCDAATHEAARRRIAFQPLAALAVKGREEPIEVYRPGAEIRPAVTASEAIVGRVEERRRLGKRIEDLAAGRGGSVVILEGEAGLGKSRLVAEVVERARERGLRTLVAAGDAVERSAPYHPWRALFDQLLGLDELSGSGERERRVVALLAPDLRLSSFAALLNPVLHLGLAETERTRSVTPRGRAHLTLELLVRLFASAGGGEPTVVVLEDAHWYDSASWALAEGLHLPHVLLLAALRPLGEELPAELRRLQETEGALRLRLETFGGEEARALVCQRLGARELDDDVARLIFTKAEGHPFFTEELANALRDRDLIRVNDGVCRFTTETAALDSLGLPDTVQAVVTSRIDHLSPAQQLTLKVASVLGRTFDLQTLTAVHPIAADRDELPRHVEALAARDLAHRVSSGPVPTYEFKHSITQEASYSLLPFAQRRQLHQTVAAWYETRHAGDLSPVLALLAHHWSKAEAGEKSIFYLDKAGEQAFNRYANEEAVRFYNEAIDTDRSLGRASAEPPSVVLQRRALTERDVRRVRWERHLGEAQINLGRWQPGWDHLERALALLGHRLPATPARWMAGLSAQAAIQLFHRWWPRTVQPLEPQAASLLRQGVRCYSRLCALSYLVDRHAPLLYTLASALNLAERLGPIPELAAAYADAGNIFGMVPLHSLARRYGSMAERTARQLGDPATTARMLGRTGLYRTAVGDWAACADLERGMDLADQVGDLYQWEESAAVRARAIHMLGDYAGAAELSGELRARAAASSTAAHQVWGIASGAWAFLYLGRLDEALDLAGIGLRLMASSGRNDRVAILDLLGTTALVHLRRGELEQARQAVERMKPADSRAPHLSTLGLSAAAETYIALWEGDPEPARRAQTAARARRVCRAFARFSRINPPARARAFLWQGCREWLDGRRNAAAVSWRRSLAEAERFSLPWEAARAHEEIGRRLSAADPARHAHLAKAQDGFRRLNAALDLQRVTEKLQTG